MRYIDERDEILRQEEKKQKELERQEEMERQKEIEKQKEIERKKELERQKEIEKQKEIEELARREFENEILLLQRKYCDDAYNQYLTELNKYNEIKDQIDENVKKISKTRAKASSTFTAEVPAYVVDNYVNGENAYLLRKNEGLIWEISGIESQLNSI